MTTTPDTTPGSGGDAQPFELTSTYLHFADGPDVFRLPGGAEFWEHMDSLPPLPEGRLVAVYDFDETWPHWERHPAGDELVYMTSGSVEFVLDTPPARSVSVGADQAILVPAGVWHRAIVHEPGKALCITRGAGTEHRPV
jgi:mannose-6-phosphate isomerase-like protein (cupin superfamily)